MISVGYNHIARASSVPICTFRLVSVCKRSHHCLQLLIVQSYLSESVDVLQRPQPPCCHRSEIHHTYASTPDNGSCNANVRQCTPPPALRNSLTGEIQIVNPQRSRIRPTR